MIRFESVSFTYEGESSSVFENLELTIGDGEMCLVVGPTGSGKSTLLRMVNGLVPHFTGGTLVGRVVVDGRPTETNPPRELADIVGYVGQDPRSGFVADTVEEEIAYVLESLAMPSAKMRRRVEEALDLMGLHALRGRPVGALSGGEQQRVAIGAALVAQPKVLLLDEPTSALDPAAGEDVLAALHRLVHDVGVTVLLAEHRLERVVQFVDRVVHLRTDGSPPRYGAPQDILEDSALAPPVVQLGRIAGWRSPPVTVRDARRNAVELRERLSESRLAESGAGSTAVPPGEPVLSARGIRVVHPKVVAIDSVDLDLAAGERVVLLGRNGSGKTSLLWALQGTGGRASGNLTIDGTDPATLDPAARARLVALVPQEAGDLLAEATVAEELAHSDALAGCEAGASGALLDELVPGIGRGQHPRDLSEGQRLALALSVVLATRPRVLLLDEPTRGLDVPAKDSLVRILVDQSSKGTAVLVSTHDVEFAASFAQRALILSSGELIEDGPAGVVLTGSPVFSPQVAKVLAPLCILTASQVRDELVAR